MEAGVEVHGGVEARVVAKRPLLHQGLLGVYVALEDELRLGGHGEVHGHPPGELNGGPRRKPARWNSLTPGKGGRGAVAA